MSIFVKQTKKKDLAHRDVSGEDRQAQTHVFSLENKVSVSKKPKSDRQLCQHSC